MLHSAQFLQKSFLFVTDDRDGNRQKISTSRALIGWAGERNVQKGLHTQISYIIPKHIDIKVIQN